MLHCQQRCVGDNYYLWANLSVVLPLKDLSVGHERLTRCRHDTFLNKPFALSMRETARSGILENSEQSAVCKKSVTLGAPNGLVIG